MAEHVTLQSLIDNAIGEYCTQHGGGFPLAYLVVLEMAGPQGQSLMVSTTPSDQMTYRSMGLAQYASAWFVDDAQRIWATIGDNDSED